MFVGKIVDVDVDVDVNADQGQGGDCVTNARGRNEAGATAHACPARRLFVPSFLVHVSKLCTSGRSSLQLLLFSPLALCRYLSSTSLMIL